MSSCTQSSQTTPAPGVSVNGTGDTCTTTNPSPMTTSPSRPCWPCQVCGTFNDNDDDDGDDDDDDDDDINNNNNNNNL